MREAPRPSPSRFAASDTANTRGAHQERSDRSHRGGSRLLPPQRQPAQSAQPTFWCGDGRARARVSELGVEKPERSRPFPPPPSPAPSASRTRPRPASTAAGRPPSWRQAASTARLCSGRTPCPAHASDPGKADSVWGGLPQSLPRPRCARASGSRGAAGRLSRPREQAPFACLLLAVLTQADRPVAHLHRRSGRGGGRKGERVRRRRELLASRPRRSRKTCAHNCAATRHTARRRVVGLVAGLRHNLSFRSCFCSDAATSPLAFPRWRTAEAAYLTTSPFRRSPRTAPQRASCGR